MASVLDIPMAPNRENWYKALADENCKSLMELLTLDKRLLDEGWEADTRTSVRFNLERSWKGRTALHAAARRGDVNLTNRILQIHSESLREAKVQKGLPGSKESHLLEVIDGDYELNALAIAVVNGNGEIVSLLKKTSLDHPTTPYGKSPEEWKKKVESSQTNNTALEKITREVLPESNGNYSQIKKLYDEDCDFNFLPFNSYLFHFSFSTWESTEHLDSLMELIRENILSRAMIKKELLLYLLFELWDGQGRTPLHVAVDSQKVEWFCKLIRHHDRSVDENFHDDFLNKTDSAGRTPLYRAAAKNQMEAVKKLLKDTRTKVCKNVTYKASQWGKDLDIDRLSRENGFKSDAVYILEEKLKRKGFNHKSNAQAGPGPYVEPLEEVHSTALHVAIIHKHEEIVMKLVSHILRHGKRDKSFYKISARRFTRPASRVSKDDRPDADKRFYEICSRRFTWPASRVSKDDTPDPCQRAVSTIQLAVLVGSIPILQQLLEANAQKPGYFSDEEADEDLPSFLLAAASGNPGMIKAFLDSEKGKFNPLIEDCFGNTALHHALKGTNVQFHPHLVDFVGCNHVFSWKWANSDWISDWLANPEESSTEQKGSPSKEKSALEKKYGKREGSIDLLLQAGIDIWKKNDHDRTATPEPDALDNFVSWWYTKVAEETKQVQAKLNSAANAISVTGALVATASYVGPLQPPLGFAADAVQIDIVSVRVYVVCDSLSFYLALAAIILALVPWLPLPQESMFTEMRRTSRIVAVSVAFLFPSILCVLVAFASAYIAVIPHHGLDGGGVAVATTVFGGSLVFGVILWFLFYIVGLKVLMRLKFKRDQKCGRAIRKKKFEPVPPSLSSTSPMSITQIG